MAEIGETTRLLVEAGAIRSRWSLDRGLEYEIGCWEGTPAAYVEMFVLRSPLIARAQARAMADKRLPSPIQSHTARADRADAARDGDAVWPQAQAPGQPAPEGEEKVIKLGTLAGRHAMPVDEYILTGQVEPGQAAYDAAYLAAEARAHELADGSELVVELYYAGLTEVTLGVIDAFDAAAGEEWPAVITLMRYDSAAGEYQPLRRGIPPAVAAARQATDAAVYAAARRLAAGEGESTALAGLREVSRARAYRLAAAWLPQVRSH